jgi:hypothetical protein
MYLGTQQCRVCPWEGLCQAASLSKWCLTVLWPVFRTVKLELSEDCPTGLDPIDTFLVAFGVSC